MRWRCVNICYVCHNKDEDLFFPFGYSDVYTPCNCMLLSAIYEALMKTLFRKEKKLWKSQSGYIPPGEGRWPLVRNYLGHRLKERYILKNDVNSGPALACRAPLLCVNIQC